MARIFVPQETRPGERRVAATPETVKKLVGAGFEVEVQRGAGTASGYTDAAYEAVGATPVTSAPAASASADVVLRVGAPTEAEAGALKEGSVLFALLDPYRNLGLVRRLAERKVTSFAMELVPRTTRAQAMDVLSSQASVAGYKAVLLAASHLGKHFPLMMTAAGTVQPSRIVILGAGVAGLQALATAKRLGAIVEVSDVRAAVKEQVESLGGRFIDLPELGSAEGTGGYAKEVTREFLDQQRAILKKHIAAADVVISTAQVPGKKAPVLVPRDMVEAMRPGSVIVDLAAETGGNCELTAAGETVEHGGVAIVGTTNLPSLMAFHASQLYSRNVAALLQHLAPEGELKLVWEDEITSGACVTRAEGAA